jgi:tetratricopeptide (TPR) repeat protein
MVRTCQTLLCAAGVLLSGMGGRASAQGGGRAGIAFPTSGSASAQTAFLRGVSALHLFEYEDANEAFRQASQIDPGFAMAYWGEAMTYDQTLWRNENIQAARQALARLAPTPASRAAKAGSATERAWLAAIDTLFGDGDAATRHRNYADAMGRLHASLPDDPEVASFYALALLGTMSRSLIGYMDTHEGHSQMLAGSDTQARVAVILNGVLRSHPEHPGALHYLLHDQDDPEHAHLALDAARTLAKVADSSHALHMPAHIFLQLGLWHDAALSDRAAFAASQAWVTRKHLDPALRSYHALSWLEYELLQLGRYREAWATLDDIAPVVKTSGQTTLLSDLSSMRARYAIESGSWTLMANETNFGNVDELFAIGVSAARTGNVPLAEKAREGLAVRSQDPREGDLRPAVAIMEREVAAVIALKAGRSEEAVDTLRTAAKSEAQLPLPLGLPEPIKPASELLGEVLLELGRPAEAIEPFELALRRNPNRSLSVLGLARAATAAQQPDTARRHYAALLATLDRADADLPVLLEARAALEAPPAPAARFRFATSALAAVTIVGLLAAAVLLRRKKRGPVARAPGRRSQDRQRRNR